MQLLQYQNGQRYNAHHDYFIDEFNPTEEKGKNRIATVLMYLYDVGGGYQYLVLLDGIWWL